MNRYQWPWSYKSILTYCLDAFVALVVFFLSAKICYAGDPHRLLSSLPILDPADCEFLFTEFGSNADLGRVLHPDTSFLAPSIRANTIAGNVAWYEAIRIVKSFVDHSRLNIAGTETRFHSSEERVIPDLVKIRLHVATTLLGAQDREEAYAMSQMVYYLHIFDDIVDRADLLDLPIGLVELLQDRKFFHEVFFSKQRPESDDEKVLQAREIGRNLMPITRLMRHVIRRRVGRHSKDPRSLKTRLAAVEEAAYLVFMASVVSREYTGESSTGSAVRYARLTELKGKTLESLPPGKLVNELASAPPAIFYLIAKAPMMAILALEGQEYDPETAYAWSLLFAPFFYNFNKDRPGSYRIDPQDLVAALNAAVSTIVPVFDKYHSNRLAQLSFMFDSWPHAFPEEVSQFYLKLLRKYDS